MENKITPFETYQLYISLKEHFTNEKYDFFKYSGRIKIKQETFEKKPNKMFFQKIAKHEDVKNFLLANLIINTKFNIKSLAFSVEAEKNYKEWLRKQQSLTYLFKQEIKELDEDYNKNFLVKDGEHPILLKKFLGKKISLETFCILLDLSNPFNVWNKHLENDFIWKNINLKAKKYLPFIQYDKETYKKILIDFYLQF